MEEAKPAEQQGEGKVRKKFEAAMKRANALMRDPNWFKIKKIDRNELPDILDEMAAEEKEELYGKFKAACRALVDKKRNYDKVVKQKEKEFNDAVEAQMKLFLVDLETIFTMVDRIEAVEKEYYDALSSISEGTPPVIIIEQEPGEG